MNRPTKIAITALSFLAVAVPAELIREANQIPVDVAIMSSDEQDHFGAKIQAWSARFALLNLRPDREEVTALNNDAGAIYIALLKDRELAEKLLKRFIDKGLDVNALDRQRRWTPVQTVAIHGDSEAVKLLLKYGAVVSKTSADGIDLRDFLEKSAQRGNGQSYKEIIQLMGL